MLDRGARFRYIFANDEYMANHALAILESALRSRKLDRTLTTSLPALEQTEPASYVATNIVRLDACLRGGLPRGQLCELAGPHSSGRTTLLLQLIGAATRRGEIAALVDTCDRLDVGAAVAAGVDLDRLLWIRGAITQQRALSPSGRDAIEWSVDRALKALNLVLQAGGFGVVAIDLADIPLVTLKRLPFTTWLRVQRVIAGSDTACVLVVPEPLARSAGGLTVSLAGRPGWTGTADRSRRLEHLDIAASVVSPRRRVDGEVTVHAVAAS